MAKLQKKIIVTGASGFIGRNFLSSMREKYHIYGIARRSGREADIPFHPNIEWLQWDISNESAIADIALYIKKGGGADYMLHLAGYYDFDYDDKPEYYGTNILGTKNVLELARLLKVKHFIFASSLAACSFGQRKSMINERSPANAKFAYARSKQLGEQLCTEYTEHFNYSIVRFAAIFSDWCEYAPLYKLLSSWLSRMWNRRFLAGKGDSAISYLHIYDLIRLLESIIAKSNALKSADTYIASPDGSDSQHALYNSATREYFGKNIRPFMISKFGVYLWMLLRTAIWKSGMAGKPFERLWMYGYIDKRMKVDASYTRNELAWSPTPRYGIIRRMIFLMVNYKNHTGEWINKNEAALKSKSYRPNLIFYEKLLLEKERMIESITQKLLIQESGKAISAYRRMKEADIMSLISTLFHLLLASVRSGDRSFIIKYVDDVVIDRFAAGFTTADMHVAIDLITKDVVDTLSLDDHTRKMQLYIHDYIEISMQLARDYVEEIFEELENKIPPEKRASSISLPYYKKQQKLIRKLSRPFQEYTKERSKKKEKKDGEFSIYDMR
ncbi:MAG: NAD(P)-dependent oxidoreductase [Bacteroidota bacterium]